MTPPLSKAEPYITLADWRGATFRLTGGVRVYRLRGTGGGMRRTVKARQVALLCILTVGLMGLKACPDWQEKAGIFMRDYRQTLGAVQDAEIDAHRANYVSDADHVTFQSYIEKLAVYGEAANNAIARNDRGGAIVQVDFALKELDGLQQRGLLGVKNPQSKAVISALVAAVRGLLTSAKVELQ